MIHTRKQWLRSALAMLLAVCMLISVPTVALAATSSTTCVNEDAAKEAVDTAVNYCELAQDIIDIIVEKVINDSTYYSILGSSKNSADLKNAAIDIIKDEISDEMIQKAGMEPTEANRTLLATEVYDVAIMYYDHLEANGDTTASRAKANEICMKEILRFALVEVKGYSNADAVETAEFYYELYQTYLSSGEAAAVEKAKSELGTAHTYGTPTWNWASGYASATADFKCSVCGHEEKAVAATVTSSTTAASCDKAGQTKYTATVTLDSKNYTDTKTETIAATGHSYGEAKWSWADDYSTATVSKTCSKCNDVMSANGTITTEVVTEATCETAGEKKYTAKATLDGVELTDSKTETVTVGHTYGDPVWTWEGTSKATAAFTCSKCSTTTSVSATITSKTTNATCEANGSVTYTATAKLNNKSYTDTKTETIEATGHSYGEAKWSWANDYSTATVSKTCSKCNDQMSAKATVTTEVVSEATCEKAGEKKYTAKATLDGVELTDSKTETIAAGHKFSNGKCSVCGMTLACRVYGDNRYETAFKVADQLKDVLGVEKFDAVIVTSGVGFADALSGSYLAAVKKAPILLTNKFNITNVQEYISENLAANGTVYILGGTAAVPKEFEDGLTAKYERLAGDDRYLTNLEILKEAGVSRNQDVLVCAASDFADSLSASASGKAILMVKKSLTDAQKEFLDSLGGAKFTIVGGTSVVGEAVVEELKAYGSVGDRVYGENRYETSTKLAAYFHADAEAAVLAYGKDFPDGLCGGVLAYFMDAPLLLTHDGIADFTADYANDAGISSGIVLGGPTFISDSSVRTILDLDKSTEIPAV